MLVYLQSIYSTNSFSIPTYSKTNVVMIINTTTNKKCSSEFYQCITSVNWGWSIFQDHNLSSQVYVLLNITITFED